MNASGGLYTRQTYFPYGAPRTTEGSALPTDYTFTGQKFDASTTLMYYGARYYATALARFTQPDTIVPSPFNPQSLNRFSYTLNNPVRYTDPTGHMEVDPGGGTSGEDDEEHAAEEGEYVITPENVDEYLPPADTGSDQTPDHDDVQEALENPGTYESETQIAVAMFEKGYNPYADERFSSFAEYDQANLIWYFTLWTYQKRQDAGISGSGDDFWGLLAAGSAMAAGSLRNGKYAGQVFHPTNPAISAKYPNGVTFNSSGYPDFSPYATHTVDIQYTGNRTSDFAAANRAAGLDTTPRGYTWHHVENHTTMQLVPSDLHRAVGHTGGFSIWKSLFGGQ